MCTGLENVQGNEGWESKWGGEVVRGEWAEAEGTEEGSEEGRKQASE